MDSDIEFENGDDEIDIQMELQMDEFNDAVEAENISTISSKTPIKYNSVNVAIEKRIQERHIEL
jgi:hypothetical protein